ncbi:MAG: SprT-like domain-containing protein [Anaerolineae bacterium]|nr:SprT-like domain-containing protein [Anaerolineae bacterium]
MEKLGIRPGNLPARTMYAAIWFLYLRQNHHLEQHLAFVTDLQSRLVRDMRLHHNPPHIELYPSSYLFRVVPRPHTFNLLLHEGFATAPEEIRLKLMRLPEKNSRKKYLFSQIRAYTKSASYRSIANTLHQFASAVYYEPDACGTTHHLKDSFHRVNWAYFDGKQTLPHLQWSKRATQRKLGHYNPIPDTIQLSSVLDSPVVPEYALDYVMYHEMVHRELGIAEVNGRKSSHNTAFHQMEKEYANLEKAKRFFLSKTFLK